MNVHAKFPPSKAHRWLVCPGSVALEEKIPDTVQSPAALEGTLLHEAAAKHLLEGTDPSPNTPAVQLYVKTVRSHPGLLLVERKVEVEKDLCWGTLDAAVVGGKSLHIIDAKFGKHPVQATGNPQLMLYALGLTRELGHKGHVELIIVQPTAASGLPVKRWECDRKQLDAFRIKVYRAFDRASKPNPLFIPGQHCWFCRARPVCEEYKAWF
ncbi:MAG: DUF2800 domain-containing protein, partial [Desulfosoma sp.]|uniref:DUF2800 domain-containing protein n=1 Tax=Desulfosoma sp. TaxID=2603217 RepID=UPI004049C185